MGFCAFLTLEYVDSGLRMSVAAALLLRRCVSLAGMRKALRSATRCLTRAVHSATKVGSTK